MRYQRFAAVLSASLFLAACSPAYYIDKSIAEYEIVEGKIQLGDSRDKVVPLLDQAQGKLGSSERKRPEKYTKDNTLVEIYYVRSGRQPDGLTTDDEFTPYVFNNGKLVAIGWTSIGGAKSQGQASPTTNVNVHSNTIIY